MRPILIAECCQNHSGDRETLKRMVHAAAESGADYAKIQGLYSRDITFRKRFEEGRTASDGTVEVIKRPYQPEVDRLRALDLSPDDEAWFVDECLRAGVASMITTFTRGSVARLGSMGFEAVKIASYDCKSFPLLREVRAQWSKIFVSTGATYDTEIARAVEELSGAELTLLHCVTVYPTPLDGLHLRRLATLRRFCPSVGFSDHSKPADTGLNASKLALALGASCIERHFTVSEPGATRDGAVSVNPAMMSELRRFADRPRPEQMAIIRRDWPEWDCALGRPTRGLSPAELLNRDYYAGRVATKVGRATVYNWEDVELSPPGA